MKFWILTVGVAFFLGVNYSNPKIKLKERVKAFGDVKLKDTFSFFANGMKVAVEEEDLPTGTSDKRAEKVEAPSQMIVLKPGQVVDLETRTVIDVPRASRTKARGVLVSEGLEE